MSSSIGVRVIVRGFALVAWALATAAISGRELQAQTRAAIRGQVVDQDKGAIEGAQLVLSPGSRRIVTGQDGGFVFSDLGPGTYSISVRRIGYQPTALNVEVRDSATVVAITLVAIPRLLDSVRIRERVSGLRYSAVVLDQFDSPVSGAEVVAMGIDARIATDSAGRFIVPKLGRGTLVLRVRKIGYAAYLGSLRILAERDDTLRMSRLSTSLSTIEVKERGGFGSDYWAFRDLDRRMTWKGAMAGAISREELDAQGKQDLCDALPHTPTGAKLSLHNDAHCKTYPEGVVKVLIDGVRCDRRLLSDFTADRVELIEYLPARSDLSGSLAARHCAPPVYVIWMRSDGRERH